MVYDALFRFAALINRNAAGIPDPGGFSIRSILLQVYFWAGVIAVIVIIIAGFMYVVSANNSQQITRAKNAILGAIIGLVVILLAFAITNIVVGSVG